MDLADNLKKVVNLVSRKLKSNFGEEEKIFQIYSDIFINSLKKSESFGNEDSCHKIQPNPKILEKFRNIGDFSSFQSFELSLSKCENCEFLFSFVVILFKILQRHLDLEEQSSFHTQSQSQSSNSRNSFQSPFNPQTHHNQNLNQQVPYNQYSFPYPSNQSPVFSVQSRLSPQYFRKSPAQHSPIFDPKNQFEQELTPKQKIHEDLEIQKSKNHHRSHSYGGTKKKNIAGTNPSPIDIAQDELMRSVQEIEEEEFAALKKLKSKKFKKLQFRKPILAPDPFDMLRGTSPKSSIFSKKSFNKLSSKTSQKQNSNIAPGSSETQSSQSSHSSSISTSPLISLRGPPHQNSQSPNPSANSSPFRSPPNSFTSPLNSFGSPLNSFGSPQSPSSHSPSGNSPQKPPWRSPSAGFSQRKTLEGVKKLF